MANPGGGLLREGLHQASTLTATLPEVLCFLRMGNRNSGEGNGTPLQYSCLENPWMEEPGGLQSMGSLGVGND